MAKRVKQLTPEQLTNLKSRLGKEKDIDLAAKFGLSRQRVSVLRQNAGKKVFRTEPPLPNKELVCLSDKDKRDMGKAMRTTGQVIKSDYMRGAIRDKNKEVLGK